jgi:hypothetical protein
VPSLARPKSSPRPAHAASGGITVSPYGIPRAKQRDVGDGDPLRRRLSVARTIAHPAAGYQGREKAYATRMLSGLPATACNIAAALPFEIATDMLR